MSRDEIMAEVVAHLEAERFGPRPHAARMDRAHPDAPPRVTAEEAAHHRAELLAAINGDQTQIAWLEARRRGVA